MWKRIIAVVVSLAVPATVSAGPLKEAIEKAAREMAAARQETQPTRDRTRFWTAVTLIAGGAVLTTLGATEMFDDEDGPNDAEDTDESDDGEDSDWGNKALLGGGIGAAAVGGWLLFTGRTTNPSVSVRHGRFTVRHTVRF